MKPVATLTITPRPSGALTYLLYNAAGSLLWEARGYSTEHGRECVRVRLRAWLVSHPYKVVLKEEERRRA